MEIYKAIKILKGMLGGKYPISNVVGKDCEDIVHALTYAISILERVDRERVEKIISDWNKEHVGYNSKSDRLLLAKAIISSLTGDK